MLPAWQNMKPGFDARPAFDGNVRAAPDEERLRLQIRRSPSMPAKAECHRALCCNSYAQTGACNPIEDVNAEIRIVAVIVKLLSKHVIVLILISKAKLIGSTIRLKYLSVG